MINISKIELLKLKQKAKKKKKKKQRLVKTCKVKLMFKNRRR